MFVFVCSAYIKVPICVLAVGAMGKGIGEVSWGAVEHSGLDLTLFPCNSCKTEYLEI